MVAFIIICVVVFVAAIFALNYQKIKSAISNKMPKIKNKKQEKKPKETPKPEKKIDEGLSYEDYTAKKIDNLSHEETNVTVEPFVVASEDDIAELEAKTKKQGGRLSGDVKSVDNIDVNVEDLEDSLTDDDVDAIRNYGFEGFSQPSISEQIKNLPPEIKAILISDILRRKD